MAAIPVFVSSTFRDFRGERDLLVGAVRERLDELVADLGCRIEMIDLRWGVGTTEDGEDEAQRRVLDVCLDQINRARPLFLGLVGDRYGAVPDAAHVRFVADEAGVPADQVVEGQSITELEFGHGALWDSAPPGDHVILVRTIAGAVPAGWADADPERVSSFRAWLSKRARDRGTVQVLSYTATGTGSPHTRLGDPRPVQPTVPRPRRRFQLRDRAAGRTFRTGIAQPYQLGADPVGPRLALAPLDPLLNLAQKRVDQLGPAHRRFRRAAHPLTGLDIPFHRVVGTPANSAASRNDPVRS